MEQDDTASHERFLTLFTANEPAIRAFVRRLVPTRQDAADVMQGVALVLVAQVPSPGRTRPVSQVGIWRRALRDARLAA